MSTPVTVSITRRVNREQTDQVLPWLDVELAEGGFEEPSRVDVQDLRTPLAAPPRWGQVCAISLGLLPLSLANNWAAGHRLGDVRLTSTRPV